MTDHNTDKDRKTVPWQMSKVLEQYENRGRDSRLDPCPCCEREIKVFFESIETNGVVTGHYLSHPVYKKGTTERLDCEIIHLNLYEWYDTKEEAIEAWNSGEAIENARRFKAEGMSGFSA
jgi:hypothetical protein